MEVYFLAARLDRPERKLEVITVSNEEQKKLAELQYRAGREAFERGMYRQSIQSLEKAVSLVNRQSPLGGEMQIWLVTAYEAAEQRQDAIALCEQLGRHPNIDTRKQSRRLLYILKAPRLKMRPEWLTEIPDLATLDEADRSNLKTSRFAETVPRKPRQPRTQPKPDLEPIDLSQVNTQDNRFTWVALAAIALTLGGLLWLS